ncbi:DEAD/DEAH box helicase [Geobacter sp. SVR]|uniref:DEAD/DEAH box helicase n=1 Tax=Geobacter sp. SVR TaxID=2495594 RepID=UPI00143EFDEA|nr:DEAD/DEAH box helicase [Geobacter sp. SVR]BCS53962.1 ATP-dependent RNA helicase RhlB [Geobacter sp. SVR]GCF86257.1 ATP-dependent RNA helicase RhlB [Geobacter sp. SVR]
MKFDALMLPESLRRGIAEAGFIECTPIQQSTLPISLTGKDVAGQAQTGTGKTAAFLVTLFSRLLSGTGNTGGHPRALILAPTRELVVQIEQDAQLLGKYCGLTIQAIYGGVDYMKQRDALREGADVVIGTPGRLIDYLKQKVYSLKQIEMLVIDEADRMFDMGFIADLRFILRRLPPFDKRQNLMFSATLNQRVMELAYEFMNMPEKVSVTPEKMTAERIEQVIYHVSRKEKFPLLLGLLRRDGMARTMIFINTKREGEYLHDRLNANGFPCRIISGDVEQKKRLRILEDFKEGKLPILIATDVASRGLHIDGVSHVINYDLPQDCEDYVHRIGRTARAGAEGKAISLADEDGAFYLEAIEGYIRHKIPAEWAEDDLFVHDFIRVAKPERKKEFPRERAGEKRSGSRTRKKPSEKKAAAVQPATPDQAAAPPVTGEPAKKKRRRRRKPAGAGTPPTENSAE